ncbi:hypothetical protein AAW14_01510 [Streptomyces hygroscopicus]|uniref:hypothetical protein n=1 Tax=Streptomyces hygroscopicus TaxID=1912 RepID=UPI0022400212|nr:hypothetical protein [Streptomyces hygroscopicus]MCW7940732.1 hypothetical protein [Streptomyces hygroscopicus]
MKRTEWAPATSGPYNYWAYTGAWPGGAVRGDGRRGGELRQWLRSRGADDRPLSTVEAVIATPGLGPGATDDVLPHGQPAYVRARGHG